MNESWIWCSIEICPRDRNERLDDVEGLIRFGRVTDTIDLKYLVGKEEFHYVGRKATPNLWILNPKNPTEKETIALYESEGCSILVGHWSGPGIGRGFIQVDLHL